MSNYLITGFHGEPHVTAENDRGIHAALFGKGRFVLPVGEEFRAEYIGNNTIRLYDGKLVNNGAAAGIPAGEYLDLYVPETTQGMYRKDLIVFQYSQDANTLIETGSFAVVLGTEAATAEEAADPELKQQDLLSGEATFDQMPLWRVSVASTVISEPVALFERMGEHKNVVQQIDGELSTIGGEVVYTGGAWELLWENASPGSSFTAQDIALDTTKYVAIGVVCCGTSGYSGEYRYSDVALLHDGANDEKRTVIKMAQAVSNGRSMSIYDSYIHVSNCTVDGTNYTSRYVPLKIYGVKGVR